MVLLASALKFYVGLILLFLLFGLACAVNWADCPADWRWDDGDWNAPTYLETNSTLWYSGHQSIRMEKGDNASKSREILSANFSDPLWIIHVLPGDHIGFSAWMMTPESSIGCTHDTGGIRIGIDFRNADGSKSTGTTGTDAWEEATAEQQATTYVKWNTTWSRKYMNFTIPAHYHWTQGDGHDHSEFVPVDLCAWIQVWCAIDGNADESDAWFADTELFINPTIELNIIHPQNIVYINDLTVSLSSTGDPSPLSYNWNIQFPNATWLYDSNKTSTSQTLAIEYNGTLTFCCSLTGEYTTSDYEEQAFTMFSTTEAEPETETTVTSPEHRGDPNASSAFVLIIGAVATVGGLFVKYR